MSCEYIVTYVPPGCTTYHVGQIVYTRRCPGWCDELVIGSGDCAGTILEPLECGCV
jgi:hypothetical protein